MATYFSTEEYCYMATRVRKYINFCERMTSRLYQEAFYVVQSKISWILPFFVLSWSLELFLSWLLFVCNSWYSFNSIVTTCRIFHCLPPFERSKRVINITFSNSSQSLSCVNYVANHIFFPLLEIENSCDRLPTIDVQLCNYNFFSSYFHITVKLFENRNSICEH